MPDGRDYIHAAPALRLEPTGMVYRRQRLFDITKRDPALDLHLVARLPDFMGRYRYVGAKKPLVIEPGDSGPLKPVGEVGSLLRKDDRLIVLERGATVRAYPVRLVRAYGSVMDTVDDTPVLITWSYYSQVARCVVSRLDEAQVQIVDAGLSYRGCDMLSDAKTGSLWDTAAGKCVAGPMTGRELAMLPVQIVEWQTWRPDHLDDVVLMPDSAERILGIPPAPDADGADRRQRDVLDAYLETDVVPFATAVFRPGEPASDALPPKTYVLGVRTTAAVRAYPLNVVFSLAEHAVRDRMGDLDVSIQATSTRTGHVRPGSATGDDISQDVMLRFAWMELNPTTDVYAPPAE